MFDHQNFERYDIFYDDALLHVSEAGNHVSLYSLGPPFAQLKSIDQAARSAIQVTRGPAELYIDSTSFRSIQF
jgi:hypothetical protein